MKVDAVAYQAIVILHVTGGLTVADVKAFEEELVRECSGFAKAVVDLSEAKVEADASEALSALRKKVAKPKLVLAHPALKGADAANVADALVAVGNAEADLILDIFEKQADLVGLRAELASARSKACGLLGLAADAAEDAFQSASSRAHEDELKLRHVLSTLAGEIEALEKQGPADVSQESREKLTAAKAAALEALKKGNLVT